MNFALFYMRLLCSIDFCFGPFEMRQFKHNGNGLKIDWDLPLLQLFTECVLRHYILLFLHTLHTRPTNKGRFPQITGEIIWKSEACAVGHHCRRRLLVYIGPWFQNGGGSRKVLVCDSIRPSGMNLYYTGLPDGAVRQFFFFFFFFFAYYSLFGGATCGVSVWNGGLTESSAIVHYLYRVLD